jgi:arylsulfatase A-like enzyme
MKRTTVTENSFSRRNFLKAAGAGVCSTVLSGCRLSRRGFPGESSEHKPNIILIVADDLGYGDLGCYGNKTIKTPNLDSLAAGGMRFTDYHSNGAMCSPTRAALLTGRYQQRCGIQGVLSSKTFGKWHLGYTADFNPVRQGFDTFRGFVAGGLDYHSHIDRSGKPDWWKDVELVPEEGYTSELITNHAIRYIGQNRDKPFCLYLPYQAVHFPFQGPNDQADRVIGGDYWSKAKYGSRYDDVDDRKAAYKEMVEALNAGVGKIAKKVRELGLENNTLIFFTSDNGAYSWVGSNLPCRGQKSDLWEGGHRVPAIAYWPGKVKPGTVTDETALTMDLFPTMAAMAGTKLPDGLKVDGLSILPVLREDMKLPKRTLFWRTKREGAARKGPWKLLMRSKEADAYKFVGLYNLDEDIGEQNNLADKKPELLSALKGEFETWERNVSAGVNWVKQ